jgi:hypothetical protein
MRLEFGKSGEQRATRPNGVAPQNQTQQGYTAMVRIGLVGVGFMGMIHYEQEWNAQDLGYSAKSGFHVNHYRARMEARMAGICGRVNSSIMDSSGC